jgi:hypothetical protein
MALKCFAGLFIINNSGGSRPLFKIAKGGKTAGPDPKGSGMFWSLRGTAIPR